MPYNLIKTYNQLLDIVGMNEGQRTRSLMAIFNRDIRNNPNFKFENKVIHPTPAEDGEIKIEELFDHLTKRIFDYSTRAREFDLQRAVRLHWVKYHVEKSKKENMLYFSVKEPEGLRTYIYDKDEKYVIVLEPLRNKTSYYLLSAHYLTGKDAKRDKIMTKYKKYRLDELY